MMDFESLPPMERARQLANPEGAIGIDVGLRLNKINGKIIDCVYTRLQLAPNMDVLEIGFGNGHLLPDLLRRAEGLNYVGIDISRTMIDEARQFNASLVTSGQATFHRANAEQMPFLAASFDRVFAVNVIYFWPDALRPLKEIRRVLRPNGFSLIASATPETTSANPVTKPEFGFLVRDEANLVALHKEAGFSNVIVELFEEVARLPNGEAWPRAHYLIIAQP